MKALVTGRGTSGSWKCRGEQLGAAIGAHVIPGAASVRGFDVVVAVKRNAHQWTEPCRDARVPLVWDIVDPWPQPRGNEWTEHEAKAWLRAELERVRPALAVATTHRMAEDLKAMGWRAVHVPHHARPGMPRNDIRPEVRVVGYEGSLAHLGAWARTVQAECDRRGWTFSPNGEYRTFDIVLGLRESGGYPARAWKSGVKLANAQAAGVPFVGSPESGYLEARVPGVERFVLDAQGLSSALDALASHKERVRVAQWMTTTAQLLSIDNVAQRYAAALKEVAR